jgi:nucleotide-binding universal stress UspA family protein
MLQRILAPIDASPDSEKALPALPLAEQIARAHEAELVLAYIVEPPPGPIGRAPDPAVEQEGRTLLAAHEERLRTAGLRVRRPKHRTCW